MPIFRAPAFALAKSIPPHTAQVSAPSRSVVTAGYGPATGTTDSVTAAALSGSGMFSYSWACTNGWTANSPNSPTTTFTSPAINHATTSTSTATVTVTDLISGATSQATVSLSHQRDVGELSWSISPAQQVVNGEGFPTAILNGSWTITISGGSGSYSYSPSWTGDAFHSGGVAGNSLSCSMEVPYNGAKGGIWTLDVTDNETGKTLSVSRGMTFINQN